MKTYDTIAAYNTDHIDAPIPINFSERNSLRSYTRSGAGLEDDLTVSGRTHTLDFLPGGAPTSGEVDRIGTIVATRWGNGPYLVLADQVSLRAAWEAITKRWRTKLSAAIEALCSLNDASDAVAEQA